MAKRKNIVDTAYLQELENPYNPPQENQESTNQEITENQETLTTPIYQETTTIPENQELASLQNEIRQLKQELENLRYPPEEEIPEQEIQQPQQTPNTQFPSWVPRAIAEAETDPYYQASLDILTRLLALEQKFESSLSPLKDLPDTVSSLSEQLQAIRISNKLDELRKIYGDFDEEEVLDFAEKHNIPDDKLDLAVKATLYDKITRDNKNRQMTEKKEKASPVGATGPITPTTRNQEKPTIPKGSSFYEVAEFILNNPDILNSS